MEKLTDKQKELLTDIPEGYENGISNDDLQAKWNTSKRGVSAEVERLRKKGVIICSGNSGYFMPENDEELERFYLTMRKKAVSLLSALSQTRKELKKRGYTYDRRGHRKSV